jgi:NAD(P)-dependent dehydrogenase (short-subunit alcohol dehydrogenase family)/acyl dehydratase
MPPAPGWTVGDAREIVHTFSAADVEAFARLTGDRNPLHVDPAAAARSAAGGPVVHGMLAAAFVSTLIGMELPGPGAIWHSFSVTWRKMIRTGDTLRLRARVTAVHPALRMLDLEITGQHAATGDTYLEGTARVIATMTTTMTEQPLTGRRVLITGASGVLGGSMARAFAGAGAIPVLTGRDAPRLEAAARDAGAAAGDTLACDLEDPRQVTAAIGRIRDAGGVFGIVHAAAAPLDALAADDPANADALRRHWAVSVAALQQLTIGLLGGDHGPGVLVAVLTEAMLNAPPLKRSAYVAAKMAAWSLVRSFAAELGPKGVRCNAVSPGLMETPYSRDFSVHARQVEAANTPLRRLCTPEDVAAAVLFLASPRSAFVNGVNLPVTGGLSMP